MSEAVVTRVLGSEEIIAKILEGVFTPHGGVVRISKGYKGAGQIVGHLKFPSDPDRSVDSINKLIQAAGGLQPNLTALSTAGLVMSGLNLVVSAAGFYIVCKKISSLSGQIEKGVHQLSRQIELLDAKVSNFIGDVKVYRDAELLATIETLEAFLASDKRDSLAVLIKDIGKYKNFYRAKLSELLDLEPNKLLSMIDFAGLLREKLTYISFFEARVYFQIGNYIHSKDLLGQMDVEWRDFNKALHGKMSSLSVASELTVMESENILELMGRRKSVLPAIEYQRNICGVLDREPCALEAFKREYDDMVLILDPKYIAGISPLAPAQA